MVVWELDVPLAVKRGDVMIDAVSQHNSSLFGLIRNSDFKKVLVLHNY